MLLFLAVISHKKKIFNKIKKNYHFFFFLDFKTFTFLDFGELAVVVKSNSNSTSSKFYEI